MIRLSMMEMGDPPAASTRHADAHRVEAMEELCVEALSRPTALWAGEPLNACLQTDSLLFLKRTRSPINRPNCVPCVASLTRFGE